MFEKLATHIYSKRRWVLFAAVLSVAISGAFGLGVAKRLSPYSAEDPSTQSVQAKDRYEGAAGRQIDPGLIALVQTAGVRTANASRRVNDVEEQLRGSRDVVSVSSFYDSHDPAMVSADGRSTYVVAYFKPKSDSTLEEDAKRLESRFAGQHDVKLGGKVIAGAQANTQVGEDLAKAELLAFPSSSCCR